MTLHFVINIKYLKKHNKIKTKIKTKTKKRDYSHLL